ncbi:MAG: hypothetical protein KF684_11715 [Phycisphaeraceae bacterium]|nr:hypothetical protein [Phycisphaeraceae bacterium]
MKAHPAVRIAVQALGAAIGVVLFVWTIRLAFTPQNQESIQGLLRAGPLLIFVMFLLNLATIVINGLGFWIASKPVRPVPALSCILTNAVASFLAFLPFKTSFIVRVLIHNKRDGVSMRLMVPWMLGFGLSTIGAFFPMLLASTLAPQIGWRWVPLGVAGAYVCTVIGSLLGKLASKRVAWLRALSLGSYVVVRDTPVMLWACTFRLLDTGVQAGRFLVVAAAMGISLPIERAVFDATVYYMIGSASPGGVLGFREGGLAWFASLLNLDDDAINEVALLALAVTGAEAAFFCVFAVIAAGVMRLDRLVLKRTLGETLEEAPNAEELR